MRTERPSEPLYEANRQVASLLAVDMVDCEILPMRSTGETGYVFQAF